MSWGNCIQLIVSSLSCCHHLHSNKIHAFLDSAIKNFYGECPLQCNLSDFQVDQLFTEEDLHSWCSHHLVIHISSVLSSVFGRWNGSDIILFIPRSATLRASFHPHFLRMFIFLICWISIFLSSREDVVHVVQHSHPNLHGTSAFFQFPFVRYLQITYYCLLQRLLAYSSIAFVDDLIGTPD